jgi:hypothetical protein
MSGRIFNASRDSVDGVSSNSSIGRWIGAGRDLLGVVACMHCVVISDGKQGWELADLPSESSHDWTRGDCGVGVGVVVVVAVSDAVVV